METYKIAIISDQDSWINEYLNNFIKRLSELGHNVNHYFAFDENNSYDIVFLLSYSKIIKKDLLKLNKNNLVVHESDLPLGKGWSPLTWQILEGKSSCFITLFEADEKVDAGKIYLKELMKFTGNELIDDLRKIQAEYTFALCMKFVYNKDEVLRNSYLQSGDETYYHKRTAKDSELNIKQTLEEQFNILRVVDNEKYPAFFFLNGEKYILNIKRG